MPANVSLQESEMEKCKSIRTSREKLDDSANSKYWKSCLFVIRVFESLVKNGSNGNSQNMMLNNRILIALMMMMLIIIIVIIIMIKIIRIIIITIIINNNNNNNGNNEKQR